MRIKKLALKKDTIANLNNRELTKVQGGGTRTQCVTDLWSDCVTNCIICPSVRCP